MFDNTQGKDSGCSAKSCCTATTMVLTHVTTADPQSYRDHSAYLLYYWVCRVYGPTLEYAKAALIVNNVGIR